VLLASLAEVGLARHGAVRVVVVRVEAAAFFGARAVRPPPKKWELRDSGQPGGPTEHAG
jgi:hypothetical protein